MIDNATSEALKIWRALQPMIESEIKRLTRNCKRAKKMTVMALPDKTALTVDVQEPYGTRLTIPCVKSLVDATVGQTVWVEWYSDDMSTAVATRFGNGDVSI